MADTAHSHITGAHDSGSRRDFLLLTAGALGAVGAAVTIWPFIDTLNPAQDTLALATTEVDLTPVQVGQRLTVAWRGKPVFIDHRPPAEIKAAEDVDWQALRDPQPIRRASRRRNGSSSSACARISAAFRSATSRVTSAASSAAGFARATARNTIPRDASAKARRRSIWRSRPISSPPPPPSRSARKPPWPHPHPVPRRAPKRAPRSATRTAASAGSSGGSTIACRLL